MKFLGCIWCETKFGKKKGKSGGIIPKCEPQERNPCAPGVEEWTPEETSWQAGCDSKGAWNSARKMHNAEQERFMLRWNGYFAEKVQKPDNGTEPWQGKSANKRRCTKFCSRFRPVHNSAITRWNASGSIASYALLKNTDIHLSGNRWNSTIDQKWEVIYLYNGQLRTYPAAVSST